MSQLAQKNLAAAAKEAGVKRFVPCFFATICPPGGVMILRDEVRTLSIVLELFGLSLILGTERRSLESRQKTVSPIYCYRRGLLVPIVFPTPPIRER